VLGIFGLKMLNLALKPVSDESFCPRTLFPLEVSVGGERCWVSICGKRRVERDFGRVRLGRGPLLKYVS